MFLKKHTQINRVQDSNMRRNLESLSVRSGRSSLVERACDVLRINRFFLRSGRPPAISTDPDVLISPAHSRVAWVGTIREKDLFPAKPVLRRSRLWNLSQILWDEELVRIFDGGMVFNLYLSPTSLHYLLAPMTARVESVRRCPGRCWPIVFCKLGEVQNERVVVLCRLEGGRRLAMVLVGSFLVSGILFLPQPGDLMQKGDVIGGFKVGSTVFLILGPAQITSLVEAGDRLLLGEPVARLAS